MLDEAHQQLVCKAQQIIRERFAEGRHHVGAALRTASGRVFTAVHLEATVGRIDVCAEAVALGMAAAAGETEVVTVVAVDRAGHVVSPCGMCRELISDYSPGAQVIVPGADGPVVTTISSLLPNKYRSRWREP